MFDDFFDPASRQFAIRSMMHKARPSPRRIRSQLRRLQQRTTPLHACALRDSTGSIAALESAIDEWLRLRPWNPLSISARGTMPMLIRLTGSLFPQRRLRGPATARRRAENFGWKRRALCIPVGMARIHDGLLSRLGGRHATFSAAMFQAGGQAVLRLDEAIGVH